MKNEGKIVVDKAVNGEMYFKLVAENGKTLVVSETYKNRVGLANGIIAVRDLMTQKSIRVELKSGKLVKYIEGSTKKTNSCKTIIVRFVNNLFTKIRKLFVK